MGALGLVLGQRAHADMLRDDGKATLIEALFDITAYPHFSDLLDRMGIARDEPHLLLKRTMTKSGSRCYINTNLATLTMLQDSYCGSARARAWSARTRRYASG